ncbi:snaclec botrocetin subunit alpha-like isoform X3 [Stigmatopora argus]
MPILHPLSTNPLRIYTAKMAFELFVLLLIGGIGPALSDRCPSGWTQLDNRCFLLRLDPLTFDDAEAACNLRGGNLVSIQNDLEYRLAESFTEFAREPLSWIGLTRLNPDDLVWTDGSDTGFAEIVSSAGLGCAAVGTNADGLLWDFVDCLQEFPYVCARDIFQCALICIDVQQEIIDDGLF